MHRYMWLLIAFLTIGMHGMYKQEDWTVTAVKNGYVTMESTDGKTYTLPEHESWRIGDRAACIVNKNGKVITEFVFKGR